MTEAPEAGHPAERKLVHCDTYLDGEFGRNFKQTSVLEVKTWMVLPVSRIVDEWVQSPDWFSFQEVKINNVHNDL